MVESMRAQAGVEAILLDAHGVPVTPSARWSVVSPKIARAALLRDGHCRWPGCERRTGLQVHHLIPRSWGGGAQLANLAAVCTGGGTDHHARLVPHGPWKLVGNPNRPDGLRLERVEQRSHDTRAGPSAA
jgi:5-methylcytosine-specific restriction endonuclease McrA